MNHTTYCSRDGLGLPELLSLTEDKIQSSPELDVPFVQSANSTPTDVDDGILRSYLLDVYRYRVLSSDEQFLLFNRVRNGDQLALKQSVAHNLRLVLTAAKKKVGRGVNYLDLVQEGNLGLMKAAEKFDPNRGTEFSTYATWWIDQKIQRALIEQGPTIRVPGWLAEKKVKFFMAAERLASKLRRIPTEREVATEAGTLDHLDEIIRTKKLIVDSLNEPVGEDGAERGDFVMDSHELAPDVELMAKEQFDAMNSRLLKFTNAVISLPVLRKSKEAFFSWYGFNGYPKKNCLEIAEEHGMSRGWIWIVTSTIWDKIAEYSKASPLDIACEVALKHTLETLEEVQDIAKNAVYSIQVVPPTTPTPSDNFEEVEEPLQISSPIIGEVVALTAKIFELPSRVLTKSNWGSRKDSRIWARYLAVYILWNDFNQSLEDIGPVFDLKERSTLSKISGIVSAQLKTDESLQQKLVLIRSHYSLQMYGADWQKLASCQKQFYGKQAVEANTKLIPFQEKAAILHMKLSFAGLKDRQMEIFKARYPINPAEEILTGKMLGERYGGITRAGVSALLQVVWQKLLPFLNESDFHNESDYMKEREQIQPLVRLLGCS